MAALSVAVAEVAANGEGVWPAPTGTMPQACGVLPAVLVAVAALADGKH